MWLCLKARKPAHLNESYQVCWVTWSNMQPELHQKLVDDYWWLLCNQSTINAKTQSVSVPNMNPVSSSRQQRWLKRRPEGTDLQKTTWATWRLLISLLLRWLTHQTSETFIGSVSWWQRNNSTSFLSFDPPLPLPLSDRNNEEWIWAAGGSAAHGAPEHEEVNPHSCASLMSSCELSFLLLCSELHSCS